MAYDKQNDPTRAGVPITLDRPRVIIYNVFALIEYDEATGRDLVTDVGAMVQKFGRPAPDAPSPAEEELVTNGALKLPLGVLRDVLWAGLLQDDPSLTRAQAAMLFDLTQLRPVLVAVMTAINKALPNKRPTIAEMPATKSDSPSPPSSENSSDSSGISVSPLTSSTQELPTS